MSAPRLRYLSHPQVVIDPNVPVPDWPLNDVGRARIVALADVVRDRLPRTTSVWSSPERKALDTAYILAPALDCEVRIAADSNENDRSSTGFLPADAFEAAADQFFGAPDVAFRGWETAQDAQNRILNSIKSMILQAPDGDLLVIGHGAVGTLLFCAAQGIPISRRHDQGPTGGGNILDFDRQTLGITREWVALETYFGV